MPSLKRIRYYLLGSSKYDNNNIYNTQFALPIKSDIQLDSLSQIISDIPYYDDFRKYYYEFIKALAFRHSQSLSIEERVRKARGISLTYLEGLNDYESYLGVSLLKERERYYRFFDEQNDTDKESLEFDCDIREFNEQLGFVKSTKINSIEMLLEAEEYAEKAEIKDQQIHTNFIEYYVDDEDEFEIDDLSNPEEVIKKIKEMKGY